MNTFWTIISRAVTVGLVAGLVAYLLSCYGVTSPVWRAVGFAASIFLGRFVFDCALSLIERRKGRL